MQRSDTRSQAAHIGYNTSECRVLSLRDCAVLSSACFDQQSSFRVRECAEGRCWTRNRILESAHYLLHTIIQSIRPRRSSTCQSEDAPQWRAWKGTLVGLWSVGVGDARGRAPSGAVGAARSWNGLPRWRPSMGKKLGPQLPRDSSEGTPSTNAERVGQVPTPPSLSGICPYHSPLMAGHAAHRSLCADTTNRHSQCQRRTRQKDAGGKSPGNRRNWNRSALRKTHAFDEFTMSCV